VNREKTPTDPGESVWTGTAPAHQDDPVSDEEGTMAEDEKFEASRAMRRAMLGDTYVDEQITDPNPVMREFSDYLTSMAWGVWTRGGPLSTRDRSLVVMAMTAALGRMDEFRLHVSARSRTGVTDDELDELLFQVAAYCGAPAGVSARRSVLAVRAEEQQEG
jgi:4-carboxymuconolactone decarboxylase